jgi:hypothetical protein
MPTVTAIGTASNTRNARTEAPDFNWVRRRTSLLAFAWASATQQSTELPAESPSIDQPPERGLQNATLDSFES